MVCSVAAWFAKVWSCMVGVHLTAAEEPLDGNKTYFWKRTTHDVAAKSLPTRSSSCSIAWQLPSANLALLIRLSWVWFYQQRTFIIVRFHSNRGRVATYYRPHRNWYHASQLDQRVESSHQWRLLRRLFKRKFWILIFPILIINLDREV